jgi:Sodium ion transport-associated
LSAPTADQETNKIAEAFNRISRFKKWVKSSIMNGLKKIKNKITNQISVQPSGNDESWLCLCVVYLRIEWLMVFSFGIETTNVETYETLSSIAIC